MYPHLHGGQDALLNGGYRCWLVLVGRDLCTTAGVYKYLLLDSVPADIYSKRTF